MDNKNSIASLSEIWYLKENMAYRKNRETNKIIEVPVTEEILEQIKKQDIAEKELSKLLKTSNTDNKIIGKLWAFLDEYINYISYESKTNLISKMKELELSDEISVNNIDFIHSLCTYLTQNDMEAFDDTLDQFFNFNLQNIKEMMPVDSSLLSSVLSIPEFDFS